MWPPLRLGRGPVDGGEQLRELVSAVVAQAVDEERRRAVDAAAHTAREVADHLVAVGVTAQRVRDLLGVEAEVLTGQAEAAAAYRGATADLPGDRPTLVVDIGGGSSRS